MEKPVRKYIKRVHGKPVSVSRHMRKTNRRSPIEIQKSLLEILRHEGIKSIRSLAVQTGIMWLVAKNHLDHLEALGLVERISSSERRETDAIQYKAKER
jgi:predicted transcriptional regulator